MASVLLDDAWIHLADDLATYVTAALTSAEESAEAPVDVRRYANGRLRSIVRPGTARTISVGLGLVDRDVADTLRSWIGQTVMYRDPAERLVFGTFPSLGIGEVPGSDGTVVNVTFDLLEVTVSIAV